MLTVRPASGPSIPAPVVGSQIRTTPSPPRAEEVERRLLLAKGARPDHWRVTVKVTWTDGTDGEVNAWTSQWTHTHVCVFRETASPYHPFWVRASDVGRR
jgi:hypothetical protein